MRLCALWLALGGLAQAAEHVRLVYVREAGAEGCPDEEAVRRAVSARLGHDPFVLVDPRRTVRATIGKKGPWLRAVIELSDENGELLGTNQLTPKVRDCDTLASAMELQIALAIDPLHASAPDGPRPPAASPTPSPEPILAVEKAAAPAPTAVRRAPPRPRNASEEDALEDNRTRLVGRLAVIAAVSSEPGATWGFELGLAAQWKRFSVGAELRGDVPGARVVGGGTVSGSLVVVNLLPCVRAYGMFFCGLLSVGMMIASGAGFPFDQQVVLPYCGGGTRAGVEFKLNRRVAIGLHADLLAPFTQTVLFLDRNELYRADPVSGTFGLLVSGVLK
jgi:hypothetical protein